MATPRTLAVQYVPARYHPAFPTLILPNSSRVVLILMAVQLVCIDAPLMSASYTRHLHFAYEKALPLPFCLSQIFADFFPRKSKTPNYPLLGFWDGKQLDIYSPGVTLPSCISFTSEFERSNWFPALYWSSTVGWISVRIIFTSISSILYDIQGVWTMRTFSSIDLPQHTIVRLFTDYMVKPQGSGAG